jgi:hypothetical protein
VVAGDITTQPKQCRRAGSMSSLCIYSLMSMVLGYAAYASFCHQLTNQIKTFDDLKGLMSEKVSLIISFSQTKGFLIQQKMIFQKLQKCKLTFQNVAKMLNI